MRLSKVEKHAFEKNLTQTSCVMHGLACRLNNKFDKGTKQPLSEVNNNAPIKEDNWAKRKAQVFVELVDYYCLLS